MLIELGPERLGVLRGLALRLAWSARLAVVGDFKSGTWHHTRVPGAGRARETGQLSSRRDAQLGTLRARWVKERVVFGWVTAVPAPGGGDGGRARRSAAFNDVRCRTERAAADAGG